MLAIRADLGELKVALSSLAESVIELRVLVAGEYVKKADFDENKKLEEERIVRAYDKIDGNKKDSDKKLEDHKKEEAANRWKLATLTATIVAIMLTVTRWIYDAFTVAKEVIK